MGNSNSKSKHENYVLYDDDMINVLFIQVKPKDGCYTDLQQFNLLLGLNIPKYAIYEGTEYPYVFCVHETSDIHKIANEYHYEIGFSQKMKLSKSQFNSKHKIAWNSFSEPYCLKLI
jgi:hypothetical protein